MLSLWRVTATKTDMFQNYKADPLTVIKETLEKSGKDAKHVFVVFGASVSILAVSICDNLSRFTEIKNYCSPFWTLRLKSVKLEVIYQCLHFRSNPLISLYIFATVHNLMNYKNLIVRSAAKLTCPRVQYASNIKLIFVRSDTGVVIDSQPHLCCMCKTSLLFACSIGCLCSRWLFGFSVIHSN